jgi:hypothetical protein
MLSVDEELHPRQNGAPLGIHENRKRPGPGARFGHNISSAGGSRGRFRSSVGQVQRWHNAARGRRSFSGC